LNEEKHHVANATENSAVHKTETLIERDAFKQQDESKPQERVHLTSLIKASNTTAQQNKPQHTAAPQITVQQITAHHITAHHITAYLITWQHVNTTHPITSRHNVTRHSDSVTDHGTAQRITTNSSISY